MAVSKPAPANDAASSIADMPPWYCWMSNELLGRDADDSIADASLQIRAHDALATFIAMPVVDSLGNPTERRS